MAIYTSGAGEGNEDPRLNGEFERTVEEAGVGTVHLVGVVHDHPASAFRARTAVSELAPDFLALEIAPLALPLFEAYAEGTQGPTDGSDEFTAAIQAATDAHVVGIDAPNLRFVKHFFHKCVKERLPFSTIKSVLRGLASASKEASACRLAAAVTANTLLTVQVGEPIAHGCTPADDAKIQADDEVQEIERVRDVLAVLDRPTAVRVRDDVREECMVRSLEKLRHQGDIVAVVGLHHLNPLGDALTKCEGSNPLPTVI